MKEKESKYKKNWIKEGIEVAHKEQLNVKMTVSSILRNERIQKDEEGNEYTKSYVLGVKCHFWQDGKLKEIKLHTRSLVPWEVAEDGYMAVVRFFDDLNSI